MAYRVITKAFRASMVVLLFVAASFFFCNVNALQLGKSCDNHNMDAKSVVHDGVAKLSSIQDTKNKVRFENIHNVIDPQRNNPEWIPIPDFIPDWNEYRLRMWGTSIQRKPIDLAAVGTWVEQRVPGYYARAALWDHASLQVDGRMLYLTLSYALMKQQPEVGLYLQFGVAQGHSANLTRRLIADTTHVLHGFDSFKGLPEDWWPLKKGDFAPASPGLPKVESNVELHQGFFNDTLPSFLSKHQNEWATWVDIDCDLYTGAKQVLTLLQPHLRPNSMIHFSEFLPIFFGSNFTNDDELRAFHAMLAETRGDMKFEMLNAYSPINPTSVVLRVV